MKKLLCSAVVLLLATEVSAVMIDTPSFQLTHGDEWRQIASPIENEYRLFSDEYRVAVTLSFKQWNQSDVEQAANNYLEIRYNAELEIMQGQARKLEIEKNNSQLPLGYQIEYFGTDSAGRAFRYWAIVSETKIVNIYMESYDQSIDGIDQILRKLLKGLRL